MRLQILVPQHTETEDVIKPLLDSIETQQQVDLSEDVGVIIVNDGTDVHLSREFLDRYGFEVQYHLAEHGGVSAARQRALDLATADYVMFCDADDMFLSNCGLYVVFREMEGNGFDSLVSAFTEETRDPRTGAVAYINRDMDSTFVHGKVHRRRFLLEKGIRWNEGLTIHEDSYFNCLCQRLAGELKYCAQPFYLWRWRDESVCRRDPKYILKTYSNMLDSNDALVDQFVMRERKADAQFYAVNMVYDAYYTLNKEEWINQDNQAYRKAVEQRFRDYWMKHRALHDSVPPDMKMQIIAGVRTRMFREGLMLETQTFEQWIKSVEGKEEAA